jgi:hypothetical protein
MIFSAALAQEQVIEIQSAADWKNAKIAKDLENGEAEAARGALISKKSFKINPAKTYRISGEFKSTEGPSLVYLGFLVRDDQKRQMSPSNVNIVANTQTEVLEPVSATDTQIKIKDGSKWKVTNYQRIVLGAKEDFSDLPNFGMLNVIVKEVKQDGDAYVVTLAKAIGKAIEAGTPIRLHSAGGGYLYTGGSRKVTDKWTPFSGTITGNTKHGWNPKVWPPNADHAEILVLTDWGGKNSNTMTQYRNIKVEEVEKK